MSVTDDLSEFFHREGMSGKSGLCVALVMTRRARERGLPLEAPATEGGGQVQGLGKAAVQAVLTDYGITRVLAEEGGRTSRGTPRKAKAYVDFLNERAEYDDLAAVEEWWIERVKEHFAGKPLALRVDAAKSLRAVVRALLTEAEKRQKERPGETVVGSVLQHLVGAKLELLVPGEVQHHGANVADDPGGRAGDFAVGDVAIHVTTAPTEALLRKCRENLDHGLRPIIVTTSDRAEAADQLADVQGIADRVDVFDAEQFLAGNIYELGKFRDASRRVKVEELVAAYNAIVDEHEADPGLRIEVA